jgi:hypothetical protein
MHCNILLPIAALSDSGVPGPGPGISRTADAFRSSCPANKPGPLVMTPPGSRDQNKICNKKHTTLGLGQVTESSHPGMDEDSDSSCGCVEGPHFG